MNLSQWLSLRQRNDSRIIIHFDYDCFYASVIEAEQPVLKTLPLAVQQKQIVVTCNYEARRRGLRKLQTIKEAKRVCPDVVIILGEDLSRFRNASKELYRFFRGFVWNGRLEKLGFDELFLDVTDMVEYNVELLNGNDLENSFFQLDRYDPVLGFAFDATEFYDPTYPEPGSNLSTASMSPNSEPLQTRLLVASHLAKYLRDQLELQRGYTSSVGVSTSKLLSKLVGSTHKPNSQTTLLPPYTVLGEEDFESNVTRFLDSHEIQKIPGIGSKAAHKLSTYLLGSRLGSVCDDHPRVTVRDLRLFPGMGPALLDKIIGGPGSSKDIGTRTWALIHGVDDSEVMEARDVPTQISVENSYGRLDNLDNVRRELLLLAASLVRRMRVDLTETNIKEEARHGNSKVQWLAHPRTLRMSTRPRSSKESRVYDFNRVSRSAPLPQFVFNLDDNIDALAERLVRDSLLSMFRKIHPEKSGWNLSLLNVAVTNMVESAGDRKRSGGRDIEGMFRTQGTMFRQHQMDGVDNSQSLLMVSGQTELSRRGCQDSLLGTTDSSLYTNGDNIWEESDEDEAIMPGVVCVACGASIPRFAQEAHSLYHLAPD